MYRKLLVFTTLLAMVYAGVLEHPISYVSAPQMSLAHVPISVTAAPKVIAPSLSYYAAAAPKIDFSKGFSAAPALTYAAPAPKLSFAAAPALTYAPKISYSAAPSLGFAPSKVFLPAASHKIAFAPSVSYLSAPTKLSFGVAPAIALPKLAVAAPVVNYAHAVKVVDAGSYDPNPEYSYSYAVDDDKSGDQKSFKESRSKDGTVTGSYSVTEPDGSKRTVEYTADHISGFKATVHREEAKQDPMKMLEKKMKEDAKQMEEAMKSGAVMVMPSVAAHAPAPAPEMMVVMKAEDVQHAVMMKAEDIHHAVVMKH